VGSRPESRPSLPVEDHSFSLRLIELALSEVRFAFLPTPNAVSLTCYQVVSLSLSTRSVVPLWPDRFLFWGVTAKYPFSLPNCSSSLLSYRSKKRRRRHPPPRDVPLFPLSDVESTRYSPFYTASRKPQQLSSFLTSAGGKFSPPPIFSVRHFPSGSVRHVRPSLFFPHQASDPFPLQEFALFLAFLSLFDLDLSLPLPLFLRSVGV